MTAHTEPLDDFRDIQGWSAITIGQAQLALAADVGPQGGNSLRLDYDFKGGAGFVVARKKVSRGRMPAVWALTLRVRGAAPANKIEVKLIDPTGSNVWWWKREAYAFTPDWQTLTIRSSEVEFAWGPAGGGSLGSLDAIEFAIVAGPGGSGTVWLADLRFEDRSLRAAPRVSASTSQPGHDAPRVLDASPDTTWQSADAARDAWLAFDFGAEHEYGGVMIDWGVGGAPRAFDVEGSDDGTVWQRLAAHRDAAGPRSAVCIEGGARSRHLRLSLRERAVGAERFEITQVSVQPFDVARSLPAYFHDVAAHEPRGHHPRWLHREQSYWTPVGLPGGASAAILNEEGVVEADRGSCSLEPFLFVDGKLIAWSDADITVSLVDGTLPLPSSTWRNGEVELIISAYVAMAGAQRQVRIQYRAINRSAKPREVRLFVAVRPFQVTPPWQSIDGRGGVARIATLAWRNGEVAVGDGMRIVPHDAPDGFGAATWAQGGVVRHLVNGVLPPHAHVHDDLHHASGAMRWDCALAAGGERCVDVAVVCASPTPLGALTPEPAAAAVRDLAGASRYWRDKLDGARIRVNGVEPESVAVLRTAATHILINRDGAAIQPGPRRYMRSWIRDGATMSAALLRVGCRAEVRDFLNWYATHQRADGNVPCLVDRSGPDWLPEHDSHGQFVFTLAEYFRFTGDIELVERLWPAAQGAIGYMESLRAQRRTDAFREGERRACYGILPESASHEGYLAQPVHAYWDDFWGLRGLADAIELAEALDRPTEAARLRTLYEDFDRCLYASICATIAARKLNYVPGSVEWADIDPSATATAVAITDPARLPQAELAWTFDEHLRTIARRRSGEPWVNYSAYEIRILGALLRLGRRAESQQLLGYFLGDRRPSAWNQWPEISWRDARSSGHLGDVPHTWIGAEYVLAVLAMFAYEHPTDRSLVIGAGIPHEWLDGDGLVVENLPTWWGRLSYSMRRIADDAVVAEIASGMTLPPGGIVLRPPLPRPLDRVEIDGVASTAFGADSVTLTASCTRVVMHAAYMGANAGG